MAASGAGSGEEILQLLFSHQPLANTGGNRQTEYIFDGPARKQISIVKGKPYRGAEEQCSRDK